MPQLAIPNRFLSAYLETAEVMRQSVMFLDREGNVEMVSSRFAQNLGYPNGQFEPKTIFQVNPHFNFIAWKKLWNELETEGQVEVETEHITVYGDNVPAKLKGTLLEVGSERYCQFIEQVELNDSHEGIGLAHFCLDKVDEMIIWVSSSGSIVYANKAMRETLGYSEDNLLAIKISDLEHSSSVGKWRQQWEQLKSQKWLNREASYLTKSGSVFPVKLMQYFIGFGGQEYEMVIVRDLRQQKKQNRFIALTQQALDNAAQMIYWTGVNGRFLYANKAVSNKLGFPFEELTDMHLWDIEPGLNKETWQERWEHLKAEKVLEIEVLRKTKKGKTLPMKLFLNYLDFEGDEYNVAVVSDLSKQKKTDENLKLSFTTIDQSPDMIFWLNEDATFRYFNSMFSKMTGYCEDEISEMTMLDLFPNNDVSDFQRGWELLKTGQVLSSELEITCKDRSLILVESSISMIKFDGKMYSSTVLRDIRERKKQEQQLKKQLEEIEILKNKLEEENIILKEEIGVGQDFNNIISQSENYKPVLQQIGQVADTDATVLILGETGTGKELVANAIHKLSTRSEQPLIKINCAVLPENLIESELFGHEKGAFTGAFQRKIGRFEMAHRGTIFLDEIGELPLDLQAKLLRVLQEGEFRRLGGNNVIKVDVRILAATNRNLEELVEKGKFRKDLFYRLNVFPINNIPLRERKEDIPLLVRHFVEKYNHRLGRHIEEISPSVMKELKEYEYPGNIRELENLIERAIILSPGKKLDRHFQFVQSDSGRKKVFKSMENMQRQHILEALRRTKGKVTGKGGAAELLKLNDKTLYSRMMKLRIGRNDFMN